MRFRTLIPLLFLFPIVAFGQPRVTMVDVPVPETDFQTAFGASPMYSPALFTTSNGALGMMTQGNCFSRCGDVGAPGVPGPDLLYRWRRSAAGSWASNAGGLTPSMSWQTTSLGESIPPGPHPAFSEPVQNFSPTAGCQFPFTNPKGAMGTPAIVRVGNRLFMAFAKGIGDWWTGEIWWAVSSNDGATWSVYPNPVLYPFYHRFHRASGDNEACNEGAVGIGLTTTTDPNGQTWFHIYSGYAHPGRERDPLDPAYSSVDFRFTYDAAHAYGFGSVSQLFYNGAYRAHSGKYVWSYDYTLDPQGNRVQKPPYGSDQVLTPAAVASSWAGPNRFGAGSVTTAVGHNRVKYWLMIVEGWRSMGDPLKIMTSCDGTNWAGPINVDTSLVSQVYPNRMIVNNAIWYGTLNGPAPIDSPSPYLWGFLSLGGVGGTEVYTKTRILRVRIDGVNPTCY